MINVKPYTFFVGLAIILIFGGVALTAQGFSFLAYQVGFVILLIGALLQIIMGNLSPVADWIEALKVLLIGLSIFFLLVFISIGLVPYIYRLL
ncbi:MAG: hypothetical protein WAO75_09730 [Atribacterales bacterium]